MIQFLWLLLLCEEEPFFKEKKLCMPCVYVYQIDIISLLITEKNICYISELKMSHLDQ